MRARSSNCWWRSRFISMRVLFQIFSGAATDISVAITTRQSCQFQCGSIANSHFGLVATTSATRPNSSPTQVSSGNISHMISALLIMRISALGIFRNVNGPKFQSVSLSGITWRINPPSRSRRGCRGHAQPFVRHQRGNGDDGATDGTDHAAAKQAHQECALKRQIREAVCRAHQPQRHADDQRRRHEQHQF